MHYVCLYIRMNRKLHEILLKEISLGSTEAVRLILECTEELGSMAEGLERKELMSLIRQVIHKGVQAVREKEKTVSFETAAWESVSARKERRWSTRRDLRHFVRRMLKVENVASLQLRHMNICDCKRILQSAFGSSPHSYRKGRAILHSIFNYGMMNGWCSHNPVKYILSPRIQEREIIPLSTEEVKQLEETAKRPKHAAMRLSLHLMLYCGLRPTEVQRIQPEDIRWEEKLVQIKPTVSKTGGGRIIPLRLTDKLRNATLNIPKNWLNRWKSLRRDAGFLYWQADVLRHTFATYHLMRFRNLQELQLEMGHRDTNLLHSRYTNLPRITTTACRQFWGTS